MTHVSVMVLLNNMSCHWFCVTLGEWTSYCRLYSKWLLLCNFLSCWWLENNTLLVSLLGLVVIVECVITHECQKVALVGLIFVDRLIERTVSLEESVDLLPQMNQFKSSGITVINSF